MTPHEVDQDVLARIPATNYRPPQMNDHEYAEMYKAVCRGMKAFKEGKPPALEIPLSDIPKILEDLRAQQQGQAKEQE